MPPAPIPSAASLADSPVRTDAELLARIRALVQRAFRRQLWFLFFDAADRQLPLLVPMDLPTAPDTGDEADFARFLDGVLEAAGAASLAIVYERPGLAPLLDVDRGWIEFLGSVRSRTTAWSRPLVLMHSRGARLVADGDCVIASNRDAS